MTERIAMLPGRWNGLILVGLLMFSVGCGGSNDAPSDEAAATPANAEPKVEFDNRTPEQVVTLFLESLRSGDEEAMRSMLTPPAQGNPAVGAQASAADFQISEAAYHDENGQHLAYVMCEWTTHDETGEANATDRVQWVLRRLDHGWRIGGMAMSIPELDNQWRPLTFESMEEMEAQYRAVEQEILQRHSQGAPTDDGTDVANLPESTEAPPRQ
jgi:hypothetical protein